jgi:hypothetical protein
VVLVKAFVLLCYGYDSADIFGVYLDGESAEKARVLLIERGCTSHGVFLGASKGHRFPCNGGMPEVVETELIDGGPHSGIRVMTLTGKPVAGRLVPEAELARLQRIADGLEKLREYAGTDPVTFNRAIDELIGAAR